MLTDKEQLIEELEEHIMQVRDATFRNPFTMISKKIMFNEAWKQRRTDNDVTIVPDVPMWKISKLE